MPAAGGKQGNNGKYRRVTGGRKTIHTRRPIHHLPSTDGNWRNICGDSHNTRISHLAVGWGPDGASFVFSVVHNFHLVNEKQDSISYGT